MLEVATPKHWSALFTDNNCNHNNTQITCLFILRSLLWMCVCVWKSCSVPLNALKWLTALKSINAERPNEVQSVWSPAIHLVWSRTAVKFSHHSQPHISLLSCWQAAYTPERTIDTSQLPKSLSICWQSGCNEQRGWSLWFKTGGRSAFRWNTSLFKTFHH